MNLRSVLGGSRVEKKSSSRPKKSWISSLQRTKSGVNRRNKDAVDDDDDDECYVYDRPGYEGPARLLGPEANVRNVVEAHRYTRERIFDQVPDTGAGMSSTKIAAILQFRRALPPVATTAHIQALLPSPTAAERETAQLVREGTARRVVVPRRSGSGELMVLSSDLEELVRASAGLDGRTKDGFLRWLREHAAAQSMPVAGEDLTSAQKDALVCAGFLTVQSTTGSTGVCSQPEDRHTVITLESVSQAAAGSMGAVDGSGAQHEVGGTGAGRRAGLTSGSDGPGNLNVSVPGVGVFLKMVTAALEHMTDILAKARYREMPETDLREKWDGGIAGTKNASLAKKERGEFVGILPGKTKKWKDFHGLSFDWVLHEAVGTGAVEVFRTHSVGRGVRLLGS